jgi:hypothetical protein
MRKSVYTRVAEERPVEKGISEAGLKIIKVIKIIKIINLITLLPIPGFSSLGIWKESSTAQERGGGESPCRKLSLALFPR